MFLHDADAQLIPFEFDDECTGRFELTRQLSRGDGPMYGGTGIAASVIAMEAATQRDVLWVTTQFVSAPSIGDEVVCTAEPLAQGRHTAQVRVTARVGDTVAFTALGSTATTREAGLEGQYRTMPVVSEAGESPRHLRPRRDQHESEGFEGQWRILEFREATLADRDDRIALWGRLVDRPALTAAGVAFLADMIPVAVARAAGKLGAGTSLDNSMRFGAVGGTEWVLLELVGDLALGGYGHGSMRVWSPDGRLVATGSQTANMRYLFDG